MYLTTHTAKQRIFVYVSENKNTELCRNLTNFVFLQISEISMLELRKRTACIEMIAIIFNYCLYMQWYDNLTTPINWTVRRNDCYKKLLHLWFRVAGINPANKTNINQQQKHARNSTSNSWIIPAADQYGLSNNFLRTGSNSDQRDVKNTGVLFSTTGVRQQGAKLTPMVYVQGGA